MSTKKQIQANRQNAQKSTGPKTPEGKAAVRLNALKHGLLSQDVILSDENEEALWILAENLRAQLAPVGELEMLLVDRIIASTWRLRRLLRIEVDILDGKRADIRKAQNLGHLDSDRPILGRAFSVIAQPFSVLSRYEITLERSLYKALHELQRLQAARQGQDVPAPAAVDVNLNVSGD